jgi:hypothetical protein
VVDLVEITIDPDGRKLWSMAIHPGGRDAH